MKNHSNTSQIQEIPTFYLFSTIPNFSPCHMLSLNKLVSCLVQSFKDDVKRNGMMITVDGVMLL